MNLDSGIFSDCYVLATAKWRYIFSIDQMKLA